MLRETREQLRTQKAPQNSDLRKKEKSMTGRKTTKTDKAAERADKADKAAERADKADKAAEREISIKSDIPTLSFIIQMTFS